MNCNNCWRLGLICLIAGMAWLGCQKDDPGSAGSLFLSNKQDTIRFDTVFTNAVQITQKNIIFNRNSPKVQLSSLQLAGGASSPFKINVGGQPGSHFTNIPIKGGDSLYVFITVNLPLSAGKQKAPLFYKDSIIYQYNHEQGKILLYAYGQDGHRLTAQTITKDTTWNSDLPIIMEGNVTVADNTTLRIEKGTRIYGKSGTSLIINGTLKAIGDYRPMDRIVMTNSRLDPPYNQMPGGWGGIRFGKNSKGNQLRYVTIKNAITAVTDTARAGLSGSGSGSGSPSGAFKPTLQLYGCQISNSSKNAIHFQNARVSVVNSLLYNAAQLVDIAGGDYRFTYCTLAGYSSDYLLRSEPVFSIKNSTNQKRNLQIQMTNTIIFGDNETMDELRIEQTSSGSGDLSFSHCLIKNAQKPALGVYDGCIWGADPGFATIDNQHMLYDFQLLNESAAINAAEPLSSIPLDLQHQKRSASAPTIGCLEFIK